MNDNIPETEVFEEKYLSVTVLKGGYLLDSASRDGGAREIFTSESKLLKRIKELISASNSKPEVLTE